MQSYQHIDRLEPRRLFAVGALDTSFDGDGRGTVQFGARGVDTVLSSLVQPDGKIILVGSTAAPDGNGTDIAVARLNPDATLDLSFGITVDGIGGGLYTVPVPSNSDAAYGAVLRPDGSIVVAASIADNTSGSFLSQGLVISLAPDGTLDSSFGQGAGFIILNLSNTSTGNFSPSEARAVALQADGKIIVGGGSDINSATGQSSFAVARLFPDGSVDSSFGEFGTGIQDFSLDGVFAEVLAVAVNTDQSIVLTGTAVVQGDGLFTVTQGIYVVARLQRDGLIDLTFGDEGATATIFEPLGTESVIPISTCLVIQPDKKILTGGLVLRAEADIALFSFAAARYNADGSPDTTFGDGTGKLETFFGDFGNLVAIGGANQVVLQPDGKFLLVGRAAVAGADGFFDSVAVVRYLPNGQVDRTFNRTGKLLLSPSGFSSPNEGPGTASFNDFNKTAAAQLAVVPGGGILVLASQGKTLTVARLIADGPDIVASVDGVRAGNFVGGTKATARVRFLNQGSLKFSATVPVSFFLSTDRAFSTDDLPITNSSAKLALSAGAAKIVTFSYTYPASTPAGQYFVVSNINATRLGGESAFTNNAAVSPVLLSLAPAFVELSFTLTSSTSSLAGSKKGTASLVIQNTGNVAATGSYLAQLLASFDTTASTDDLALLGTKPLKLSLKPNASTTVKLSLLNSPAFASGTYNLLLRLDASGIPITRNPLRLFATGRTITIS